MRKLVFILVLLYSALGFSACLSMQTNRSTIETLPRLRGAMCGDFYVEQNFTDLEALGANLVRWSLSFPWSLDVENVNLEREEYLAWLEGALADAERAADACRRHGMFMILDLASPPGGRLPNGVFRMFYSEAYARLFLDTWGIIARRFRGVETICAYEIVNEPVLDTGMNVRVWNDLFLEAVERIRAVEPGRTVIYQPSPWSNSNGYIGLEPLPIDNVIYSLHMYLPDAFTFQFRSLVPAEYPATVTNNSVERRLIEYGGRSAGDRSYWDKDLLRLALRPVLDFQRRTGARIWVGEFSACRWAPNDSAYRYLRDCLELFEEYGWDWSYHCFRSADVWSFEHTTDEHNLRPSPTPTNRQLLLQSCFELNRQP